MPKVKPGSTRTYDPDGYRRRAVAICVRETNKNEVWKTTGDPHGLYRFISEVLLISSTVQPEKWVLPGGGVEPREEPESAALREAYEEAGVRGHVIGRHGIVDDSRRRERTWLFSLGVSQMLTTWPESERFGRTRKWFDLEGARKCLAVYKTIQVKYLEAFLR